MTKLSLTKRQTVIASGAGIFLLALFLFFLVYLPLGLRLQKAGEEISQLQSKLEAARETIASTEGSPLHLPEQKEVSSLIEELTEFGKGLGADFRSIRPQQIQQTSLGYQLLPVEIVIESSYQELGLFMGSLRELKGGVATVSQFQIDREEAAFPSLTCRLQVKIPLRP